MRTFDGTPTLNPMVARKGPGPGNIVERSARPPRSYSREGVVRLVLTDGSGTLDVYALDLTEKRVFSMFAVYKRREAGGNVLDRQFKVSFARAITQDAIFIEATVVRVGAGYDKKSMYVEVSAPRDGVFISEAKKIIYG